MTKHAAPLAIAALMTGFAAVQPVSAQTTPNSDRVNEIIVFGTDPCPRSTDDQVVVCKRVGEEERFRIPERLREGGSLQQRQAWANKVRSIERVGRTGIQSCSPVGPAGYTGCLTKIIEQARGERKQQADDEIPPQ